jgi:hypothetical protein
LFEKLVSVFEIEFKSVMYGEKEHAISYNTAVNQQGQ